MLVYETENKVELVKKIEKYQSINEYVIKLNDNIVYRKRSKQDIDLIFNELTVMLKNEKLKVIKG